MCDCVCAIAAIGFAFDIYELLMLPLIIKPAIAALSGPLVEELVKGGMAKAEAVASFAPGGKNYVAWARLLFFVPALAGGVFGLLGGYLTDRLGRRRVLTFSILLYAFSALGAGFATSLPQLLVLRCLVFIGVCVEFVAAVVKLLRYNPDAQFTSEDVLQRVGLPRPAGTSNANNAVGAMMSGLAKRGIIRKTSKRRPSTRTSSHGREIAVWCKA